MLRSSSASTALLSPSVSRCRKRKRLSFTRVSRTSSKRMGANPVSSRRVQWNGVWQKLSNGYAIRSVSVFVHSNQSEVAMARPTLDEILSDDSDLLDVKPGSNVASTEHQRVIDSLEEINRFVDRFNRKPGESDKPSVSERGLQIKLNGLRNDVSLRDVLMPHDRHGLFSDGAPVARQTLDDI